MVLITALSSVQFEVIAFAIGFVRNVIDVNVNEKLMGPEDTTLGALLVTDASKEVCPLTSTRSTLLDRKSVIHPRIGRPTPYFF